MVRTHVMAVDLDPCEHIMGGDADPWQHVMELMQIYDMWPLTF